MVSTPETEKDETSIGAILAWPCCDEPPEEDWPPDGAAPSPPCCVTCANSPLTVTTVMLMLPVAAPTSSSAAIWVSFFAEMDCWPGLVITRERLNLSPCCDSSGGCMPKRCGPASSILRCCVTVMSVPTP